MATSGGRVKCTSDEKTHENMAYICYSSDTSCKTENKALCWPELIGVFPVTKLREKVVFVTVLCTVSHNLLSQFLQTTALPEAGNIRVSTHIVAIMLASFGDEKCWGECFGRGKMERKKARFKVLAAVTVRTVLLLGCDTLYSGRRLTRLQGVRFQKTLLSNKVIRR